MNNEYKDYFQKQINATRRNNVIFEFVDGVIGRGKTYNKIGSKKFYIEIETPILFERNSELYLKDMSIAKDFCISELSFGHEISHPETLADTYLRDKVDAESLPVIIGYTVRTGNQSLYNNNYFSMPQEVVAELNGIEVTKKAAEDMKIPTKILAETLQERINQSLKDYSSDEWFIKDYNLNDLDSVINSLKNKSKKTPKFLNVENLTKQNGIQEKKYDVIYQYFLDNKKSPFWEVKNKTGTLVITTRLALAINLEYNKSPQMKTIRERIETGRLPLGKEILEFDKVLKESVDYLKSPNSKELFDFAKSLTKEIEPEP